MDSSPTLATVRWTAGIALSALCLDVFLFLIFADSNDRDPLSAVFFAVQTMTTAGAGSATLNSSLKVLACIFTIAGSAIWALFVGQFAGYVLQGIQRSD